MMSIIKKNIKIFTLSMGTMNRVALLMKIAITRLKTNLLLKKCITIKIISSIKEKSISSKLNSYIVKIKPEILFTI